MSHLFCRVVNYDRSILDAVDRRQPFHPQHLAMLRERKYTDETIRDCGFFSVWDREPVRRLLGARHYTLPMLMIPHWDWRGLETGYVIGRLLEPIEINRKLRKYLAPKGCSHQALFPPFPCLWEALRNCGREVLWIIEGWFKAISACQAGVPAIGINGPWGGFADVEAGKLVYQLEEMPWSEFEVVLVPDMDPRRNPHVHLGFCKLASILAERGAWVRIAMVPPPLNNFGEWLAKGAADDFIRFRSEEAFAKWAWESAKPREYVVLGEYRRQMKQRRVDAITQSAITQPGVIHLDRSPFGAGKSHADLEVLVENPNLKAVICVPTHENCEQVVAEAEGRFGLNMADIATPGRLTPEVCQNYDEASAAQQLGLNIDNAVCRQCPHRDGCAFKENQRSAMEARIAVVTHRRVEKTMWNLMHGRDVLFCHENLQETLQPTLTAGNAFAPVSKLAELAKSQAAAAHKRFFDQMIQTAEFLHRRVNDTKKTATYALAMPPRVPEPSNVDRQLWLAKKKFHNPTTTENLVLVRDLTAGLFQTLVVQVDEMPCGKETAGALQDGVGGWFLRR